MPRAFAITPAKTTIQLDSKGAGEVSFTVTNASKHSLRGRARVVVKDSTNESWLSIAGEIERDFPPDLTQQFIIRVQVPQGTPAGTYRCAISVASIENPDEEYAESPVVAFEVKPSEPPPKKFPWWILIVIAAVLVVASVVIYLVIPKGFPIPSVVNLTEAEAKRQLEQLCDPAPCLTVKVEREGSDEIAKGKAIRTDPPEGEKIKHNSEITLFISEGRGKVVVKKVVGTKEADAKATLESLCDPKPCVKVNVIQDASDEFADGVATGTEPQAGEPVEKGGSVSLFVSQVVAAGTVQLAPSVNVDLDTGKVGVPPAEADVVFFFIPKPFGLPPDRFLSPVAGSRFARLGDTPAHPKGCFDANGNLGAIPLITGATRFLCVVTNSNRVSEIKVLDVSLTAVQIEFKTWNRPLKVNIRVGPSVSDRPSVLRPDK